MDVRPTRPRPGMRGAWWLLAVMPLLLLGQGHVLWGADEPREAEIAREMVASGDWVVPHLNGLPFLEKPPLAYWGSALVFELAGEPTERWCRLPSAFWSALAVAACAWLGAMLYGRRVGVLAAVVLATSQEFLLDAHTLLVDVPLAAGVGGALALLWRGYAAPAGRRKSSSYLAAAAACGMAFLAKGPIGVVLPAAGALAFVAWRKDWREGARMLAPLNLAAFAAITLPWVAAVAARGGSAALRTVFVDNTLLRFFSPSADHAAPPWDYAFSVFGVLLPWAVFLPPVVAAMVRPGRATGGTGRARWQYLVAVTGGPLLLLSIASAKRPVYLLPLIPGFAVVVAAWLDGALADEERRWAVTWRSAGTAALALAAIAGWAAAALLAERGGGWMPLAVPGLLGAAAAAVGLVGRSLRGRAADLPAYAAGFAVLACLSLVTPPLSRAIEGRRGYATLTAALTRVVTPGTELYGYRMGERELGVACFHQRALIPQIADPRRLRGVLERRGAVVLMAAESVAALRSSGEWPARARIVAQPAMRDRPFVLVRGDAR